MSRVIFRLNFCGIPRPESCNNIRQSVKRNYNLLRTKTVFYRENSSPVMSSLLSRAMGKSTDGHMTREAAAMKEREKYLSMSVEEKRKHYKCRDDYTVLDDVQTWEDYMKENRDKLLKKKRKSAKASVNSTINKKVSVWRGDITTLEIDAIVNAANNSLLGGGGVDGAIHRGAGSSLKMECATLNGCDTGDAKISGGHKLPAKHVIHTVGPVGHQEGKLKSCYARCLSLVKENNLKSVAFPCISTGIYGYPNLPAAHVAIGTARKFLEDPDTASQIDRIIFCLFLPIDVDIYDELLQYYFPVNDSNDTKPDETEEKQDKEEAESGTKKSESDSNTPEKLEANANEKMETTAETKVESNSSEKSEAKDEDKMETAEETKGESNSDEIKAEQTEKDVAEVIKAEQTEKDVAEADEAKKTATSAL